MTKTCSYYKLASLLFALGISLASARVSQADPLPTPSPTPPTQPAIAIIESIVVNGVKTDAASPTDIEILRVGSQDPIASVQVGMSLFAGDRLSTKEDDQVVLRIHDNAETNLLYIDPNSQIKIDSICVVAGKVMAWIGLSFRVCTTRGTLGVTASEFDVEVDRDGNVKVSPHEGGVMAYRSTQRLVELGLQPMIKRLFDLPFARISSDQKLTLSPDGVIKTDVPLEQRIATINYWSDQIIKASQPQSESLKGYLNYAVKSERTSEFKKARLEALVNDKDDAYVKMGEIYNDWDLGFHAAASLNKVKDAAVKASARFLSDKAQSSLLRGKLDEATRLVKEALEKDREYMPAYYVSGQIDETRAHSLSTPLLQPFFLEQAKLNYARALQKNPDRGHLNKTIIEADLDRTINALGSDVIEKGITWRDWLGGDVNSRGITYTGNAFVDLRGGEIPELKWAGETTLYIIGDQFKMKAGSRILTGRIIRHTTNGHTSVAMQFDDPRMIGLAGSKNLVLSLKAERLGDALTLKQVPNQAAAQFTFSAKP